MISSTKVVLGALAVACTLGGCGSRSSYWDQPVDTSVKSYGLANGVALVDDAAHRVVIVGAQADHTPMKVSLSIGHSVTTVATSPDGTKLFVLSQGDWPLETASDQHPSLTVIDATNFDPVTNKLPTEKVYPMTPPLPNLAIDPLGTATEAWAVAYSGTGSSGSFVENPNEIVLFNLAKDPAAATSSLPNPVTRNLRSFGGVPQRLVFTPDLRLPDFNSTTGTVTRLLLVESNVNDLTLLDLHHAGLGDPTNPAAPIDTRAEITVQLTNGATSENLTPAGVVVDDGDPADPNDARIALWTSTDSNVYIFELVPSTDGAPNPFTPTPNLAPVGGVPSQVAFVHTSKEPTDDYGLRVAALVPTMSSAVLIDTSDFTTNFTTQVTLPAAYTNMSLVTSVVGTSAVDVALLWAQSASSTGSLVPGQTNVIGSATGVAFWNLGDTLGGIAVVSVSAPIAAVYDVPGAFPQYKILDLAESGGLVVLDLSQQTASPLSSTESTNVTIAPDGKRMWAYVPSGIDLAWVGFPALNPLPLTTDTPIENVYDVQGLGGTRALIATHAEGTWGATIFDAIDPQQATARSATSLLLEATP